MPWCVYDLNRMCQPGFSAKPSDFVCNMDYEVTIATVTSSILKSVQALQILTVG